VFMLRICVKFEWSKGEIMRFTSLVFLCAFGLIPIIGNSQTYPTKPVKLIVPFAPGGTADALARPFAERLSVVMGQPVIIENRPGASSTIGADFVAKSIPDGYTLLMMPGTHVLGPFLLKSIPFDPINDFTPLAFFGTQPELLIANTQLPFANLKDMFAWAKANPGKLTIGSSDSLTRTGAELLVRQGGIQATMVNYKGGGPMVNDILAGHLMLGVGTPPTYLPLQKDKRITALVTMSTTRLSLLPEVPTVAEAVGFTGFDVSTWYALSGPAKISRPVVEKLQLDIQKVLADPEMKRRILDLAINQSPDSSPERTGAVMRAYSDQMGKLIIQAGIKPE